MTARPKFLVLGALLLSTLNPQLSTCLAQAPVSSGTVTTIAGNGLPGFSGDGGLATNATIGGVNGLAVGPDGTLYFADTSNYRIRAIDPATGIVRTIAGNGGIGDTGNNGPATNATLGTVLALAVDRGRNALYLADVGNNWVREVDLTNGLLTVYAGVGPFGFGFEGDGGPATAAQFNVPESLVTDAVGTLSICDVLNYRIRQVDPITSIISTIAGDGSAVLTGDGGPATSASFADLTGIAADSMGNLFIVDSPSGSSRSVRRIDNFTSMITTIAGGGTNTPGSGLATNMNFTDIRDLAANGAGELFIATPYRVFKLDLATGHLTPFAGDGIGGNSSSNGVPALEAEFNYIAALVVPPGGGLIIADADNARIRYVAPDSINLANDSRQTALYLPWVSALTGDLTIVNNPNLTDVILSALTSVAGQVEITGNTNVTNVDLSAVSGVTGSVVISSNASAETIALGALETVAGAVIIHDNGVAGSVDLSHLFAAGSVEINGNTTATNVDLSSVSGVTGPVVISDNASARTIALGSISSVLGNITIESNAPGTTVDLSNLTSYGCGTNEVTMTLEGGTFAMTNGLTLCTNATLNGSSTVDGSVTNNGTIEPGSSPGTLNIAGNLVLLPGSRLRFELGGTIAGSQYDQLNISNAVICAGALNVQLISAFTPSAGQVFQLINAPSRLGAFASVNLPALPAGLAWTNRLAIEGSIGVVAPVEPPQLLAPLVLSSGSFQFAFTNLPGLAFKIMTTTNLALPVSNWTVLGPATELTSGQYRFTDTGATNRPQRFYRVRWP